MEQLEFSSIVSGKWYHFGKLLGNTGGPRQPRGLHRTEVAAAILLALRARPLAPPLLATVQAPCPGSHPHEKMYITNYKENVN